MSITETRVPEDVSTQDCDREPIHVPEAIQPHGFLLVLDPRTGRLIQGAGDIETFTGRKDWLDRDPTELLGPTIVKAALQVPPGPAVYVGRWRRGGLDYDVSAHQSDGRLVVEAEQAVAGHTLAVDRMAQLDQATLGFERARTLTELCDEAAAAFRTLTGFDRVMVYRFLDDDSGQVLAEARVEGMQSFLNQHFPASDVPKQARALYVRNVVRVIPDSHYEPRPLRPALDDGPLDMSESVLRSVSPIHLKYLRNMEVRASASVSIVIGGRLWGLVACHNRTPLLLGREQRSACAMLSRVFARHLKARLDADMFRDRLRARALEEEIVAGLEFGVPLIDGLSERASQLMQLMDADGFALAGPGGVVRHGACPDEDKVREIADWVLDRQTAQPVVVRALSTLLPEAAGWGPLAAGLIAFPLLGPETGVLLWFRAEHVETVRWAGDPHAGTKTGPIETLNPRASFEAWAETVRGQARPWGAAHAESAERFRDALTDFAEVRALRLRKSALEADVADRDDLLNRQSFLMREVNHRVQNSLQLVSSFLALQAREHGEGEAREVLEEARRRIKAVSLVHRRLYRADAGQTVALDRYLSELIEDLVQSLGEAWRPHLVFDLAPLTTEPERAITLGLIFTELMINAQKYAYGGQAGPLSVSLEEVGGRLRLVVADEGEGDHAPGKGFGSRMIEMLAGQLGGEIAYEARNPGLAAELTAPTRLDTRG